MPLAPSAAPKFGEELSFLNIEKPTRAVQKSPPPRRAIRQVVAEVRSGRTVP